MLRRSGEKLRTAAVILCAWQGKSRKYIIKQFDFHLKACLMSIFETPAACNATQAPTRMECDEKRFNSSGSLIL